MEPKKEGEPGSPSGNLFQFQFVHRGDAEAAINVNDFTGDAACQIRAEERGRVADIFDGDGTANRGNRFAMRQHLTEIFDA